MTDPIGDFFVQTLQDGRLSRAESKALLATFRDTENLARKRGLYAQRAYQLAKSRLHDSRDESLLEWLFDIMKLLHRAEEVPDDGTSALVAFSPGEEPRWEIKRLIETAVNQIDCCVFTITDDEISDSLVEAHRRGVSLRVISDDDKSFDRGSDLNRLANRGVPVRLDKTDAHMHHKFALFDRTTLLTGSYNWTRSAWRENAENIVVTDERRLVRPFLNYFDELWRELRPR